MGVLAVAFMFPVLAGPVTGDDRYWYLWLGSEAEWTPLYEVERLGHSLEKQMNYGRVNVLTEAERRVAAKALIEPAVATSTPITAHQAVLKLLLVAVGVLGVLAMVRSLRWRDSSGRLVRAGRRDLLLTGAAGTLAVAVGARANAETASNGWMGYPALTYGAVISVFGAVALLLWLTRLVAENGRITQVVAVVVLVLVGVATNFRYELVFAAVPVAVVALVVVPVTDRARQRAGRRAKLIAGVAYFGSFFAVFAVTRVLLSRLCARQECYAGAQMELDGPVLRTFAYNVLSPIPGVGREQARASLVAAGVNPDVSVLPTSWAVLAGIVAAAALLLVWWSSSDEPTGAATAADTDRSRSARPQAVILGLGATFCLLGALSTAAVMSVSPKAYEIVVEPGVLYRNAMVTWNGLAFAIVLSVLAIARAMPARGRPLAWAALAVVIGTVGALSLPGNMKSLHASRLDHEVSEAIAWEVVRGDIRPGSNARRCVLYERAGTEVTGSGSRMRLYEYADRAFRRYYGRPFCNDMSYVEGARDSAN